MLLAWKKSGLRTKIHFFSEFSQIPWPSWLLDCFWIAREGVNMLVAFILKLIWSGNTWLHHSSVSLPLIVGDSWNSFAIWFLVQKYNISYGIIPFNVVQGLRSLYISCVPPSLSVFLSVCVCIDIDKDAQFKCRASGFLTVNKVNHIIATWSMGAYSWIMVPISYHAHVGRSTLLLVIF